MSPDDELLVKLLQETREDVKIIREKVEGQAVSLAVVQSRLNFTSRITAGIGVFASTVLSGLIVYFATHHD